METGAQTGGLMPAGVVWNAAAHRSGLSAADLTGVLGRAFAASAVTHAVLIGLLGASILGARALDTPARPRSSLALQATLRLTASNVSASPLLPLRLSAPVLSPDASKPGPVPVPVAPAAGTPLAPNAAVAPSPLPVDVPDLARYYLQREVDQPAAPLEHAAMLYPENALKRRISGVVVMDVYIGSDGKIDRTEVVRAEPPGVFEQAVRDALQASRFRPALLGRVPVNSRVTIEVPFDPDCSDFMTCRPPDAQPGRR